jgi:hypothetical protein
MVDLTSEIGPLIKKDLMGELIAFCRLKEVNSQIKRSNFVAKMLLA